MNDSSVPGGDRLKQTRFTRPPLKSEKKIKLLGEMGVWIFTSKKLFQDLRALMCIKSLKSEHAQRWPRHDDGRAMGFFGMDRAFLEKFVGFSCRDSINGRSV